jgi:hypothetical protein
MDASIKVTLKRIAEINSPGLPDVGSDAYQFLIQAFPDLTFKTKDGMQHRLGYKYEVPTVEIRAE